MKKHTCFLTIVKISLLVSLPLIYSCKQPSSGQNSNEAEPVKKLQSGNTRFISGYPVHPDETLQRIRELKRGQHPFAIIVSCSDSRIPPELIFDQGLGALFTIRNAGNVIGDYELGSIEYAVEHLKCNLVVVLGHEECGAIKAYMNAEHEVYKGHIKNIIEYISNEAEEKAVLDSLKSNPDLAVRANIQHAVNVIRNSEPLLKRLVEENKLSIIGAYYDLDTGAVEFSN